jgi:hypothetical protein
MRNRKLPAKNKPRVLAKPTKTGISLLLFYWQLVLLQQLVNNTLNTIQPNGLPHLKNSPAIRKNHIEVMVIELVQSLNIRLARKLAYREKETRVTIPTAEVCALQELHDAGYLQNPEYNFSHLMIEANRYL